MMDWQILEKLLLLVSGGVLASLGAWINDFRSEKRRKREKLEQAYLEWLNSEAIIRGKLKEFIKKAEVEEFSASREEIVRREYEVLRPALQSLTSAMNLAFIYEKNAKKRKTVDILHGIYHVLAESLEVIVDMYSISLKHHILVESILEFEGTDEELTKRLGKEAAEKYQKLLKGKEKTSTELSARLKRLSEQFEDVLGDIKSLDELSAELREILVS